MKNILNQFARFAAVGIIAFLIDCGLLLVLTEILGLWYFISSLISFVVSVVFSYVASMKYVFSYKKKLGKIKEFEVFFLLSSVGLLINQIGVWYLVEHKFIHYLLAKLVATVIVTIWNFTSRKMFLEGRRKMQSLDKY